MKQEVVGTPGPFAMAVCLEISAEYVYYYMGEKEGK